MCTGANAEADALGLTEPFKLSAFQAAIVLTLPFRPPCLFLFFLWLLMSLLPPLYHTQIITTMLSTKPSPVIGIRSAIILYRISSSGSRRWYPICSSWLPQYGVFPLSMHACAHCSLAWASAFPTSTPDTNQLPQAWVDALDDAVSSAKYLIFHSPPTHQIQILSIPTA